MYDNVLRTLAVRQLMLGQSAIVDYILDDSAHETWRDAVDEHDGRLVVVECWCSDESLHRTRLESRTRGIPGWHEVGWDHVERMRAEYPPLTAPDLRVDAADPLDANLLRVAETLHDLP